MRIYVFLCLAVITCAFSACTETMHVYVPSAVNVPLLKEKNEVKGLVSLNAAQIAYAPTDHFAVMAGGQWVFNRSWLYGGDNGEYYGDDDVIDYDARGSSVEVGAGYFTALDEKRRAVFDVYGGVGIGNFRTIDDAYYQNAGTDKKVDYKVGSRFTKFFVQPSIGLSHKVIEVAFTPRFSVVRFRSQTRNSLAFANDPEGLANFTSLNNTWVPFLEPTVTFKVGYKYIKYSMQLTVSNALRDDEYSDTYITDYFQRVAFNVGASFNFGSWLNAKR